MKHLCLFCFMCFSSSTCCSFSFPLEAALLFFVNRFDHLHSVFGLFPSFFSNFVQGSGRDHCFPGQWGLCEYVIVLTILGGSPVILWISLGGKPKWLPLKFGYHDVMRTSPIFLVFTENRPLRPEGHLCKHEMSKEGHEKSERTPSFVAALGASVQPTTCLSLSAMFKNGRLDGVLAGLIWHCWSLKPSMTSKFQFLKETIVSATKTNQTVR